MLKIKNSYLVEVNLGPGTPAAGQQINFSDQPFLKNKTLIGLEVLTASEMATSPSGKTRIVAADVPKFAFTFQQGNERPVFNMALNSVYPANNSGFYREFAPFSIDFNKSVACVCNPVVLSTEPYTF